MRPKAISPPKVQRGPWMLRVSEPESGPLWTTHSAPRACVNNRKSRKQTRNLLFPCDSTDAFNVVGLIHPPPPTQLPLASPQLETEVDPAEAAENSEQVLFLRLASSLVWWKRALVVRGASALRSLLDGARWT